MRRNDDQRPPSRTKDFRVCRTYMSDIHAYMDAPSECKRFLGRVRRKAVRLSRTFGLFVAALHPGRGPVWRCAGRVRIDPASLMVRSSHITGCPDPVSKTVCPYPSCGLPTFLPAPSTRPPLRRGAPAPCSLPCSASAPRRCAPSCSPAPPPRASSACAPASGPATNPAARRGEPPGESPTSPP